MKDIDLVVLWVDGSDPDWQKEKNKYSRLGNTDSLYYQDWNLMRYWFRCVEENMPWVRYIFFVTYGHLPKWLNLNNPKLKIVRHEDFMPAEFLPSFNSNAINLNIFRIKELSETFIYADDDMFFIGKQSPDSFFTEDGIPKDYLALSPVLENYGVSDYSHLMLNNMLVIKKYFDMQDVINLGKDKYLSENYPDEFRKNNERLINLKYIPGFKETHNPNPLLKSTFEKLWEKESLPLFATGMHKFRNLTDLSIVLIRDYQLAGGKFVPSYKTGRLYTYTYSENLENLILSKDTDTLCINESEEKRYTKERADEICSYFEKRFPNHSSFETD